MSEHKYKWLALGSQAVAEVRDDGHVAIRAYDTTERELGEVWATLTIEELEGFARLVHVVSKTVERLRERN